MEGLIQQRNWAMNADAGAAGAAEPVVPAAAALVPMQERPTEAAHHSLPRARKATGSGSRGRVTEAFFPGPGPSFSV